jgi:hypothetical protein
MYEENGIAFFDRLPCKAGRRKRGECMQQAMKKIRKI